VEALHASLPAKQVGQWMALAEVDQWGEDERLMATAVAWLWNAIARPEKGKGVTPQDVMIDWLAEREQPTEKPRIDRAGLNRMAGL